MATKRNVATTETPEETVNRLQQELEEQAKPVDELDSWNLVKDPVTGVGLGKELWDNRDHNGPAIFTAPGIGVMPANYSDRCGYFATVMEYEGKPVHVIAKFGFERSKDDPSRDWPRLVATIPSTSAAEADSKVQALADAVNGLRENARRDAVAERRARYLGKA